MDFPREDFCSAAAWEPAIKAIITTKKETGSRVAILSSLEENLSEEKALQFLESDIIPLSGITSALQATVAVLKIGKFWDNPTFRDLLWAKWEKDL